MALQVTGNIQLDNGLVVNELYGRVNPNLNVDGKSIYSSVVFYSSKQSYINYDYPVNLMHDIKLTTAYDRLTDGNDLLQYSSEWIKFQLESKGYTVSIIDL